MYGADVQVEELVEKGGCRHVASDRGGDLMIELAAPVVVGERYLDRGRRTVVGYVLGFEEIPDPARLDLSQTHVGPCNGRDRPGVGPAVAVEHRQGPQVPGLVVHLRLDNVAQGAQVGATVGVHHALRLPRSPGGVVYGDGLLLVLQDARDRLCRALGEVVLVGVAFLPSVVDTY